MLVLLGIVVAQLTFGRRRPYWQRRSALFGARVGAALATITLAAERLALSPVRRGAEALESHLPALEGEALSPLSTAGRLANRGADAELPAAWLALAIGLVACGALLAALLGPGVTR